MPSHYCPPSTWWAQALEEGMAGVRHGDGLPSILMCTETACRYNSAHLTLLTGARAICAVGKRSRLITVCIFVHLSLAWDPGLGQISSLGRASLSARLTHTSHCGRTPAGTKLRRPSSVQYDCSKTKRVRVVPLESPIISDTGRLPMRPKVSR